MPRVNRLFVLLSVLLALLGQTVSASAAPAPWDSVDVTVHSEQGKTLMIVSGKLPEKTKLPADVELPVPAGSQVQWAGEILGGPVDKDPSVQYKKATKDGLDVYTFTLAKSRTGQLEVLPQGLVTATADGSQSNLTWTAIGPVKQLNLSFRVPQTAKIVTPAAGASMQAGPTGYSYYSRVVKDVKAGQTETLAFSYSGAAASTSGGAGTTGSSDTVVLVLILGAALAFFAVLLVKVQRKMSPSEAPVSKPQQKQKPNTGSQPRANAASKSSKKQKAEPVAPAPARRMKPVLPMIAVIAVLVVGFAVAGMKGTEATTVDGKLTRSFGAAAGATCQSASLPITPNPGVDLAKQGEQLLKGFEGMEGVGEVSIDVAQSKIDMAWCESSQSEDSMRQAISKSGLVTLGQSATAPASAPSSATVDAGGTKQTASVDTSSGRFAPSQIALKAGVPAEISFGAAAGCLSEVVIGDLGVNQDLTKGPATVQLPALKAGTYTFACAMGHQSGQLVVQ